MNTHISQLKNQLYCTDSLFQMFQLLKHISATYKSDLLKMDM